MQVCLREMYVARGLHKLQQRGSDVPLLPAFGKNTDRFLVQAQNHSLVREDIRALETDAVTAGETDHESRRAFLGDELQALDNQVIEKKQIFLSQALDGLDSGNAVGDVDSAGFHSRMTTINPRAY